MKKKAYICAIKTIESIMYEQYLQLSNIPCGAVLNRIMTKEGISQSQLAERSGIVRQRICDYLANRRRITVEASLNLEKALQIGISGFFYRIQANHDIYICMQEQAKSYRPNLKCYRRALFWDTDMDKLDWDNNRHWIIRRAFEYGNEEEILETIRFYGKDQVRSILLTITDERKAEIRKDNLEKYLS